MVEMDEARQLLADALDGPIDKVNVAQPELFQAELVGPVFARLRREAPVHYCRESAFGGYWSITRYHDIEAIEMDHQNFSSDHRRGGITIASEPEREDQLPMFIAMDPPDHAAQRRTIAPAFSQQRMNELADLIRARSRAILDSLPVDETFDWVDRVSIELTAMTLATLFDFPQERRRDLVRWSNAMLALPGGPLVATMEDKLKILGECFEVFTALWHQRKAAAPAADLISMLAHGETTRDMPLREYHGNMMLLIVGGNDTTRSSISGSALGFNRFPGEFEKLRRDPGLTRGLASEAIRWQTPLAHMRRTATRDVDFGGQRIREGDKVILWYLSGNRDEAVIEDGDRFWIDRPNVRRHLAFGHGIHRCIGARLAELQVQIFWDEFLRRFDAVELVGEPRRSLSTFVSGYAEMPARLSRRAHRPAPAQAGI